MTDQSWESLSNQLVAVCGVLYFLALIAHLVEWAALRRIPASEDVSTGRVAMFGRLGLLLTGLAALAHLGALVGRGMAADPNRVPWGNMYEFTLSGTFVVAAGYLLLHRRFGLAWMAPIVVTFVLATLMVAVVWLYDPVSPLTEALYSPWLVIHVVSAILATGAFTLAGITPFSTWSRAGPGRGRPATSPGCRTSRPSTACPTGCTPSASPCGPSPC